MMADIHKQLRDLDFESIINKKTQNTKEKHMRELTISVDGR